MGMNEELLEEAAAEYLAGFLTGESVPAHVVPEDGTITEDSLPVLVAGLFVEVDEQHVVVKCESSTAEPRHRGSQRVDLSVGLLSPKDVGRSAHAARARLLRKATVRDDIVLLLNAQATGLNVQHVEYTGVKRGQDKAKLSTALEFSVLTNLTA